MPGNEFGERIHNFFGQDGQPQGQHQSQVVEGSWLGYNNGLSVGNPRQIDSYLISNLKNYNAQQSVGPERGQSSNAHHGLNYTQQPIRSEFSRSQLQNHQQPANGYMHGNQVFQSMQSEANFLGIDAETGGHRLTSKGVPPELHKVPMRLEIGESPVNYDFFSSQQQINSQLPGMLQSLPRQQMTFNELQLLQQQVMIKQMHEYQMQQQLQKQQLQSRQLNSFNQVAGNGSRLSDSHSHPLINGVPLHDVPNNSWQPELMTANSNWLQHGISPVVQGSSSGLMINPEQGQMNLIGSVPQQFEHSLYGVPVTGARGSQKAFSATQMDKLALEHATTSNSSVLPPQHAAFSNQGDIHESHMLPRSLNQEKMLFSHTSVQGSNNRLNFENLQQDDSHERNNLVHEKFVEKPDSTDPSEKSCMKMAENVTAPQKGAMLDPTEEKILFGPDDNLWDAFGNSTNASSVVSNLASGSDQFGAFPSLQSGSWSALMQSAVAETSSGDARPQEWGSNQQTLWADNNGGLQVSSRSMISAQDASFKASVAQDEGVQGDATQTAVNYFQEKGSRFIDHGLSVKPMSERNQMTGFKGRDDSCPTRDDEGIGDRLGIWKATSNSNSAGGMEQKNFFTHNLQSHSVSSGFTSACAGNESSTRDVQGNIQQHLNSNSVERAISKLNSRESSQNLESSANDHAGKTAVGINELGNSALENSGDSFRSNLPPQNSGAGFRESAQLNARYSSMLPGGKQMQSDHVGRRSSIPRKFQYHPMGDIDANNEPCREKVTHFPPTFRQVPGGSQGYFVRQTAVNRGMEKGHVSQGDLNSTNEASHKGMHQDYSPSTSDSVDRTVDRCDQVKNASSRQTMLELLHKVDQSQEHSLGTSASGLPEAKTYAETGGQLRHNQSSASQGFSLQLAPPSQPVPPDNVPFSRSSLQAFNSLNSLHNASGIAGTSQSSSAPWASNQSFLHRQETHKGAFPGIPGQINCTPGFPFSRTSHQNQQTSVATGPSAANQSVHSEFEVSTSQMKEIDGYGDMAQHRQPAQIPFQLNPITHNNKEDSAEGFPMLEAMSVSQPLVSSSSSEKGPSSAMMPSSGANISTAQHQLWSQLSKPHPDILRSQMWSINNLEGRVSGPEKTNQTAQDGGGEGPSTGANMMNVLKLQGKDIAAKNTSDAASMISKMAQSDLQTLGRSFMPHNLAKEKNSLHPEHMTGSGEDDSINRAVMRGEDNSIDPQNLAPRRQEQSPPRSDGLVRDGSLNCKESVLPFGKTVSQSFSNKNLEALAGPDHPQISPQMAPSWFGQYGTFKNGLVQPLNDACRSNPSKIAEQSSSIAGKFVDGLHCADQASKEIDTVDPSQVGKMQQGTGAVSGAETVSFGSLPIGATEQLLTVDRPKKRKIAVTGLVSWSKEVMQGSKRPQTLSEAEADWARASNRFAEKFEVEAELLEDIPPVVRSKRRLMFTTQLIQRLFCPPPARVMSLVAGSNYETVVYTAARGALGDACSSVSTTRSESLGPPNDTNLSHEKMETREKISDQYVAKAAEDFNSRAQRLESKFTRLGKGITIPDLRVEIQDIEKFSLINRFARFHARGPSDGTENSSSTSSSPSLSSDRTTNPLRLYPQRYVTVAPMPQSVPDRVQCLSL